MVYKVLHLLAPTHLSILIASHSHSHSFCLRNTGSSCALYLPDWTPPQNFAFGTLSSSNPPHQILCDYLVPITRPSMRPFHSWMCSPFVFYSISLFYIFYWIKKLSKTVCFQWTLERVVDDKHNCTPHYNQVSCEEGFLSQPSWFESILLFSLLFVISLLLSPAAQKI